ncbi:MAG: hypothetical protein ACUVQ1_05180 [Candidatus Kapaibacteriales bacterium]
MIDIIIFFLHILGWAYAFTKVWQRKGIKPALLSIAILFFIFIVLWTITSPTARLIMPKALDSAYFTVDTLSLVLLIIPESVFFYFFFIKPRKV